MSPYLALVRNMTGDGTVTDTAADTLDDFHHMLGKMIQSVANKQVTSCELRRVDSKGRYVTLLAYNEDGFEYDVG